MLSFQTSRMTHSKRSEPRKDMFPGLVANSLRAAVPPSAVFFLKRLGKLVMMVATSVSTVESCKLPKELLRTDCGILQDPEPQLINHEHKWSARLILLLARPKLFRILIDDLSFISVMDVGLQIVVELIKSTPDVESTITLQVVINESALDIIRVGRGVRVIKP